MSLSINDIDFTEHQRQQLSRLLRDAGYMNGSSINIQTVMKMDSDIDALREDIARINEQIVIGLQKALENLRLLMKMEQIASRLKRELHLDFD